MSNKEKKTYRLKRRGRDIEEGLSAKDLLKRIAAGKFNGEEEVAQEPDGKWHKISAHPTFYDAFLKRLYSEQYESPDPGSQIVSEASKIKTHQSDSEKPATRQADAGKTKRVEEEPAAQGDLKTTALPPDNVEGGTRNNSLFKDLFSQSKSLNPDPEVVARGDKTNGEVIPELESLDAPPEENGGAISPIKMPGKLDIAAGVTEEESAEVVARRRAARRRRQMIWGSVALFLLVLLFQSGGGPHKSSLSEQEKPKVVTQAPSEDLLANPGKKGEKVQALLAEGERLVENDTPLFYLGAQELFAEALTLDEKNVAILGSLTETTARLFLESSESDGLDAQLKDFLKRGRALDPHFSQFYLAEALFALYQDKKEEASALINSAIETDPSNINNYLGKGEILYHLGDYVGAKAAFDEVVKANPAIVRAHYFLAKIALDTKELPTARREALATLRLNPIHASSYFVLGRVAAETGKLNEAKQLFETCIGLAQFGTRKDIGKAYYNLAKIQDMVASAEAKDNFRLAYYYFWPDTKEKQEEKLKGLDLSEKALKTLANTREYGPTYFSGQGDTLLSQKRYEEGLTFLEAAALLEPNNGMALVKIGEVLERFASRKEDVQAVVLYYERAIERQPDLARAFVRLGLFESEQYNLVRAHKLLQQAVALAPQESEPYVALGKHFFLARDFHSSITNFEKAFEINPGESEILLYAGRLRMIIKANGEKEATTFFYRSYLLNPQNYDSLVEWLKLRAQNGDKIFAVKFLRNLLESEPDNANYYWALGEVYAMNKEHRKAIDFYHKALDIDRRFGKVRMAAGKSHVAIGELERAAEEFRTASQLDPKNHEGYFLAAELFFQMKSYERAEAFLNRVLERCPNYPAASRNLSRIYVARGQKDQAVAAMQREVQKNPLNAKFRIELAELLTSYGKYEEAVTELTEVTNRQPARKGEVKEDLATEKVRAYLDLSRNFRALNRFDSAEGAIKLALDTDPKDPELHRELGYVYHGLQRDKEAIRAFELYLERNPAATDATAIRSMIKGLQIEE